MKAFVLSYKMNRLSPRKSYLEDEKFPKGLTPLESSFSSSDVGNKETRMEEESKRKVGDTIFLNIGTPESPKIIKLGAQCSDEVKEKFTELIREFQYVFAWPYKDLRDFDPALIQHTIPIKERVKLVRQKQIPINPALEATIRKELEKLLKANIIFPVKYSSGFQIWSMFGRLLVISDYVSIFTR
jgi:hypothetical protein